MATYAIRLASLEELSRSFATRGSFYVLGAGVSVPHVPITHQLSELILESFVAGGIFQTTPIPRDIVTSRVVRDPECWRDPLRWEFVQRLPPAYVIAKLPELLSASHTVANPNYEVFKLAKPSTIFNFNVDGLASRICKGHLVLETHGRTPGLEALKRVGWSTYASAILEFPELPPPFVPGLILPGPEPASVLERKAYLSAARSLTTADYVAVIGYSFGSMDDAHTYAFLTSGIPKRHRAILVVSPDPGEVAFRVAESLKSNRVFPLSVYWEPLARAILGPGECRKSHPVPPGAFCARCVSHRYEAILDLG